LPAIDNCRCNVGRKKRQPKGLTNDLGMNAIGFGKRLDGHACTLVEVPHPGMGPNDGLDQTLVAR
jgi:hypothetical protein